jgi:hypothetical protein
MARTARQIGMILLGIWLILTGILGLTGYTFTGDNTLMGVLALIAGILLLLGR